MGFRRRCDTERKKTVVAFFTGQEVMAAMYKAYPERFDRVPDQSSMWFSFVEGGMSVEVVE